MRVVGGVQEQVLGVDQLEGLLQQSEVARPLVWLRRDRLALLLGTEIADEQVTAILAGLELPVIEQKGGWLVTPPSFRFDLASEEDLIEGVIPCHPLDVQDAVIHFANKGAIINSVYNL